MTRGPPDSGSSDTRIRPSADGLPTDSPTTRRNYIKSTVAIATVQKSSKDLKVLMPSRSKFSLAGTTTREAARGPPQVDVDFGVKAAPAIPVAEKENTEVAARITPG